jgi:quercetin dioxygenase-like cupin family protein
MAMTMGRGIYGCDMQTWDISALAVEPHRPVVLSSDDEGRAIVLALPAGERLQEHQVHERAWLMVVSGAVEVTKPDGEAISGGAGLLVTFEPAERHEVAATEDARLLLVLSPWPGEGHPSNAARSGPNPG